MVRVDLHGRRVGGWVVALRDGGGGSAELKTVRKITGWGPPAEVVDLAGWAAWRWAGRRAHLLSTASPPTAVRGLPAPAPTPVPLTAAVPDPLATDALARPRSVVRLPPAADALPLVLEACGRGPALVLAPSHAQAAHLALRLRRAGRPVALLPRDWARAAAGGHSVVGTRAAAWAPAPDLAAVVVLDEHDEAWQEERTPTWHGRDVAAERARRAGVPCVLASPCPTLEALQWGELLAPARDVERSGWAPMQVVDRRRHDPATGLYSEALVDLVRSGRRVVCVLNRKGRAQLLACHACAELARCETCGSAVEHTSDVLRCRRCGQERPVVCAACGATRLKNLRIGVTRAREDLERLARVPVAEVTGDREGVPDAPVLVGTEAVLHRAESADAVAFLEFDQELLAPRYRAAEEALALLARAARLVGGRAGGGRVLVQTRLPRHPSLLAALHGDPARVAASEGPVRERLRLPPAAALAVVSGEAASAFVAALGRPGGIEVLGPASGRWLVKAADHPTLCDALAAVPRPPGRLRVEVDPLRA